MSPQMHDKSLQKYLIKILECKIPQSWFAAILLSQTNDPGIVQLLIKSIDYKLPSDEMANTNNCAIAFALGNIKDVRAVKPLIKLLKEECYATRSVAAWALGEIGDKRARNPLHRMRQIEMRDSSNNHRPSTSRRYEGSDALMGLFFDYLNDEIIMGEEENYSPIDAALGKLGGQVSAATLQSKSYGRTRKMREENLHKTFKKMLELKIPQAWFAAIYLGESDDPKRVKLLIDAIDYGQSIEVLDNTLNCAIAWALGNIKEKRSVPALKKLLKEECYITKAVAAWALGEIGDPSAIRQLKIAGKDDWFGCLWYGGMSFTDCLEGEDLIMGLFHEFLASKIVLYNPEGQSAIVTALEKLGVTDIRKDGSNSL